MFEIKKLKNLTWKQQKTTLHNSPLWNDQYEHEVNRYYQGALLTSDLTEDTVKFGTCQKDRRVKKSS